jgi:hypothetical protein
MTAMAATGAFFEGSAFSRGERPRSGHRSGEQGWSERMGVDR